MSGATGAIVAGVATVGSAVIASDASRSASRAQQQAAQQASDTQLAMYNQNREDQTPYRESGYRALSALNYGLGLDGDPSAAGSSQPLDYRTWLSQQSGRTGAITGPTGTISAPFRMDGSRLIGAPQAMTGAFSDGSSDPAYQAYLKGFRPAAPRPGAPGFGDLNRDFTLADFTKDPGYQFRLDEGRKALEASAAARGMLLSGATLKELDRYNQDFASGEYSNAYNRFNADRTTRFNRLASLAGVGQTSLQQTGQQGQQTANNIAENQLAAGNARAAGAIGQGNAINNGLQTLGNWYLQRSMYGGAGGGGGGSGFAPSYVANPAMGGGGINI